MDRFTGGCLCGNVRFVASGRPYRVGLCHCLDCRKHHGALFHASAVFPQDAVTIEGETRDYAGRFFCPRCGSSLFGRTADEIEVNLGSLDAPDQLVPTYESLLSLIRCSQNGYCSATCETPDCLLQPAVNDGESKES